MNMRTLSSLVALTAATLTPLAAHATGVSDASPTGKGIVGGTLLGAELVVDTEAAFGVQQPWAYIVGGVAGGAGGGIGGYFVEQNTDARPPMLMLAGGFAFLIPSIVLVAATTAYQPPASYLQDQAPADEPVAEPPAPTEAAPAAAPAPAPAAAPPPADAPAPPPADAALAPTGRRYLRSTRRLSLQLPPPALFGLKDARLALGVPSVAVFHAYSRTERLMFNAPDVTEVRIPVLDVVF